MSKNNLLKKGFTLLEILLVVGIIAILAGIVIVAINPGYQLAKTRDSQRKVGIIEINKAIVQYYITEGEYPPGLTTVLKEICLTGDSPDASGVSCTGLINLSMLVPDYLPAIPVDPSGGGYKIALNSAGNAMLVATLTETGPPIISLGTTTVSSYTLPSAPETCTSFTYSAWSACVNGTRTQAVATSSPDGCIGGNPVLSEGCTVVPNNYVITFDENGGTGSLPQQTMASGTTAALTTNSGDITRTGFTFVGWTTYGGGLVSYTNGQSYTMHGSNVTLYAVWGPNLSAIENISGIFTIGSVIYAGALTPAIATVSYQWQSATTTGGIYSNINGETSDTYTLVANDLGKYIKVIAVGTGYSSGTVSSNATSVILGDVTFNYNGSTVTYGTVYNPTTTKVWLDRNLGAMQVAISSNDTSAYGDWFQWGRGDDGHQSITLHTTVVLSSSDTPGHANYITNPDIDPFDWRSPQNDNLWQGVNGINNPCPTGFRLPTASELDSERLSWSSQNTAGAFASPLKLTTADGRDTRGWWFYSYPGYYWSSTVNTDRSTSLYFGSTYSGMTNLKRVYGLSVRCIKD